MKLTDDELATLADRLQGTTDSIQAGLTGMGLDIDAYDVTVIEDDLLDYDCELCQGCGWWCESGELAAENDDDVGYCSDCRGTSSDD